jgi:hypothetical protein
MLRGLLLTTVLFSFALGSAAAAVIDAPASEAPATGTPATEAPEAAPHASRPSAGSGLSVDGAFSLPGGIWNCETLGNSTATSVYKLESATTISERTKLVLAKRPPVELDTLFTYSPKHDRWTVSLQDGKYVGTAPAWSNDTWTFNGTYIEGAEKRPVRLVYTSLGADAVRIDFQAVAPDGWRTFSGATCKREIP